MIGVKEALGLLGGLRYLASAQLTSTQQMIRQMADLTESFRFAMQRALELLSLGAAFMGDAAFLPAAAAGAAGRTES